MFIQTSNICIRKFNLEMSSAKCWLQYKRCCWWTSYEYCELFQIFKAVMNYEISKNIFHGLVFIYFTFGLRLDSCTCKSYDFSPHLDLHRCRGVTIEIELFKPYDKIRTYFEKNGIQSPQFYLKTTYVRVIGGKLIDYYFRYWIRLSIVSSRRICAERGTQLQLGLTLIVSPPPSGAVDP